ncbi:phosphatidylserine decarboxylase family protein [bacterium]|nr:phosphatidylserine decarboxylase family protein [bacterium]
MTFIQHGWEFLVIALLAVFISFIVWKMKRARMLVWCLVMFSMLILVLTMFFYRDPVRTIPEQSGIIVSPADGKIVAIDTVSQIWWNNESMLRISIYLSLMNVHINRIPVSGTVMLKKRYDGSFHPAYSKDASDKNTAVLLGIQTDIGPVFIKQITGMLARRIICRPQIGDSVNIGQKYGLIKLGSRVECFLPLNTFPEVKINEDVKAGESVLAKY